MRKDVELVPLKQFSERISEGWAMVPGYPLAPGDYAVLLAPPGWPPVRSNVSQSASARNGKRYAKKREEA